MGPLPDPKHPEVSVRRNLWAVLGATLLLLGVVLFATSGTAPTDFGWFAYAPLDGQVEFSSEVVIMSRGRLASALVAVLGLLVLAAGLGYRAGVRRAAA